MIKQEVTVVNKNGIHARPASAIIQVTNKFDSEIFLSYGDVTINAKSIMGVIMLGAAQGTVLTLLADGADENEAIQAISALFANKFEEA